MLHYGEVLGEWFREEMRALVHTPYDLREDPTISLRCHSIAGNYRKQLAPAVASALGPQIEYS